MAKINPETLIRFLPSPELVAIAMYLLPRAICGIMDLARVFDGR